MRTFASDNTSGAHPAILAALVAANEGHALAYGDDPWTQRATSLIRDLLGGSAEVLFAFGGTGANVTALHTLVGPGDAVLCTEWAHIHVDECGAPERLTGAKLVPLPSADGRLTPEQVEEACGVLGDQHHVQPAVVSLTQATELGTVWTADQIAAVAEAAHRRGLRVHVDGARLANAVAALGRPVRELTEAGVDVLTFGGTKNGMVFGEAVVWLDPGLATRARFARKQAGQLPSKTRFVAAQFEAALADGLWLRAATHANAMAALLAERAAAVPGVTPSRPTEANAVFALMPRARAAALQERTPFYVWDERPGHADVEVRWVASWDTTEADVDAFVSLLGPAA
jgi:threonine aldolase